MLLPIKLSGKELKEIEEFVRRGDVESVHDFVRYAIQNQLQLERDKLDAGEVKDYHLPKISTETVPKEKYASTLHPSMMETIQKIDLGPTKTKKFVSLDASKIRERTKGPMWALKNKYFPLKFVLRVIQKIASGSDEGGVSVYLLREEIKRIAFPMRSEMESLDEKIGSKRGDSIATGFPINNENSFDRFFNNFVVYVSPDENIIKGMPYELGFIDFIDGAIVLTEDGYNFACLYSPILDGYLREKEMPKCQFSDEELNFLYEHIRQKTISEKMLFSFMLSQIERRVNTPEGLNKVIKPFLEEEFPKKGGYSVKSANSIRAGVTSRMVELKLIKIEKMRGRSVYKVNEMERVFDVGE